MEGRNRWQGHPAAGYRAMLRLSAYSSLALLGLDCRLMDCVVEQWIGHVPSALALAMALARAAAAPVPV